MKKRLHKSNKLLTRLIYLLLITCIVTSLSMARFHSTYSPSGKAIVANWNVSINNEVITNEKTILTEAITLEPDASSNVISGKLAPGYGGHFDIVIDSNGTDVTFDYTISLNSEILPTDIEFIGYGDESITDSSTATTIENNTISGTILQQESKTIRIFWMWNDVRDHDATHTSIATSDTDYIVEVEIALMQKIV